MIRGHVARERVVNTSTLAIVAILLGVSCRGPEPVTTSRQASSHEGVLLGPKVCPCNVSPRPTGVVWRYFDGGTLPPADGSGRPWYADGYDDSGWSSGPARLGYGGDGEATTIRSTDASGRKLLTAYFRNTFEIPAGALSSHEVLVLDLLIDDGAVLYLNGHEVARHQMDPGPVTYGTLANTVVGGVGEHSYTPIYLDVPALRDAGVLREGTNVVAVSAHQDNEGSSDIGFDLEIRFGQFALIRGPYLQMGTAHSATVRWRTNVARPTILKLGKKLTDMAVVVHHSTPTKEHTATVTDLAPNTKYYYQVLSPDGPLAGGDENHWFITSPSVGQSKPTRIWVLGDPGTADHNQRAVRDAYYKLNGSRHTELILMLGDNAYETGTDAEYQRAVFEMYGDIMRKTFLWPTIGNHDTAFQTNIVEERVPYFNMFDLPTNGEAGGMPSTTERYYSFDYGNIHFVCLDSMTSSRAPDGAMATWLESDLAANTKPWIIAFFHHPPYSKGSHNSDTEVELIQMRQNILPILERYGADLVLTGHSHSYERSYLLNGHYGRSDTLAPAMLKSASSGSGGANEPYVKTGNVRGHEGTVYAVAGSSGKISGGRLNHPAMFVSLNRLGSMVLDIIDGRMEARFLRENGAIDDVFTILKGPQRNRAPLVSITAPADKTSVPHPAAVSVTASASDGDGRVTRLVLYRNSDVVATSNNGSLGASLSLPIGVHNLWAEATDDKGATSLSRPIDVVVTPPLPSAPGNLMAAVDPMEGQKINLTWTDSDTEVHFPLQRAPGLRGPGFETVAIVPANATSVSDTGLALSTEYRYRIQAWNSSGFSAFSNEAVATTGSDAAVTLIPFGANWLYLDNGSNPPSAWRELGPAEASLPWGLGPGPLGYGRSRVVTTIGFGPDANNKYITSYFRRTFHAGETPADRPYLVVRVRRDDGAVLYLNGVEIFRTAMPGGPIGHRTLASSGDNGDSVHEAAVSPTLLVRGGLNVLAAEVHQDAPTSSDIVFDGTLLWVPTFVPPRPPAELLVFPNSPTSIRLVWTKNSTTHTGFRIERSTTSTSSGFSTLVNVGRDASEHLDTGLATGTTYHYRARALYVVDGATLTSSASSVRSASPTCGAVELCGDRIDNNCNGQIDEGFALLGTACAAGPETCPQAGTYTCSGDRRTLVCTPNAGALPEDTEPPTVSVAVSPTTITADPNGQFVPVDVRWMAADNCDTNLSCGIARVTSSEPCDPRYTPRSCPDWQITDDHTVEVRALRDGTGTGRTYTITVSCVDDLGNVASASAAVLVPKL